MSFKLWTFRQHAAVYIAGLAINLCLIVFAAIDGHGVPWNQVFKTEGFMAAAGLVVYSCVLVFMRDDKSQRG